MIKSLGYIAYRIGIGAYSVLVQFASLFNAKAALFTTGRKGLLKLIESTVAHDTRNKIWFHCASLGEFEQARPVMEQLRKTHSEYALVVSFFSPSGYEIRKNYTGADYIFYLPIDTPANAQRFVAAINPSLVFFVKYEIWYHYLKALGERNIPVVLISANFRTNHIYFKWYGLFFKQMLTRFNHIFCQNEASEILLNKHGITQTSVSKDTRFDRVVANSNNALDIAPAAAFCQNHKVLIAGSSYEAEEQMIATVMQQYPNWKIIIAPHHIAHQRIESIQKQFEDNTTFSELSAHPQQASKKVLIIDNIGMLASLYRYAHIAFVGGGFGKTGLHNTLEACVFGMPILFGPNNLSKFPESLDMIEAGVGFVVSQPQQMETLLHTWDQSPEKLEAVAQKAKLFISSQTGATEHIISYLKKEDLIKS